MTISAGRESTEWIPAADPRLRRGTALKAAATACAVASRTDAVRRAGRVAVREDHAIDHEEASMRDARQPDGVARPSSPYSPVVVSGGLVFTAGQVCLDESGEPVAGGIAEQTAQALANVEACLAAAGCTLDDVQKVNAYLADLADFAAYNDVYRSVFAEPYPARTTVQAGLPAPFRVEIEAVARVPGP